MKGPVETVGGKGSHLRFRGELRSQHQKHMMSKWASLVYKDFIAKPELSRDAQGERPKGLKRQGLERVQYLGQVFFSRRPLRTNLAGEGISSSSAPANHFDNIETATGFCCEFTTDRRQREDWKIK